MEERNLIGKFVYCKELMCFGVVYKTEGDRITHIRTPAGAIEVVKHIVILIPSLIELIKLIWSIWKDFKYYKKYKIWDYS